MEHFGSPANPDEEDREIISGFVMESLENLETVEFSLMDMEENPDKSFYKSDDVDRNFSMSNKDATLADADFVIGLV